MGLGQLLAAGLVQGAHLDCRVRSKVRPWTGTYRDLHQMSLRLAGGLKARGVGPGDVVAFQLPNWMEAVITFYAVAFLGAVVVPIVHFYGEKEVGFILRQSGASVLVTASDFGRFDYLTVLERLRPELGHLRDVFVVGGGPAFEEGSLPTGMLPLSDLLNGDPIEGPVRVDPAGPALVAYTSGTTADPKGVVHAHRTIGFEVRQLAEMQATRPAAIVGAPVGHGIGMLSGLLLPVYRRKPMHLIDVWDPRAVLEAMVADGVSAGSGSTYFLTSLLDHPDFGTQHVPLMREVGLGGSPIPGAVAERAEALGLSLLRSYGSTEHPSTTGSRRTDSREKRLFTDGCPLTGVEIKLCDDLGHEVARGDEGEIVSRGPDRFACYTAPELTADAIDEDGWYSTGDVGYIDRDGFLVVTDRKKDIIIRGGENVSAAEVEEALARLPGVLEVAVVAAPDPRFGEHGCAFLKMVRGTAAPDLDTLRARLKEVGMAPQKWPEDVRVVDEFPRTPSGKIQKFRLRDRLRSRS